MFKPLFEVTKDPRSHPELHVFLQRVIGFDTVDDESKIERRIHKKFPYPRLWDLPQSPPYSYWWVHIFDTSQRACLEKSSGFITCSQIWRVWTNGDVYEVSVSLFYWTFHRNDINGISSLRHFRSPTSLWRGWWYRPSYLRLPHFAFDISWDLAAQGSCASISFLSQANWNSNESIKQ